MKLRNNVLLGISITWVLFLIITYICGHTLLINSFLKLEDEQANRDLFRIEQALDQNKHSLYTFTVDWAHWNDLYDYMHGTNPAFVPNNFSIPAFVNSAISVLTYWTKEGKLVVGVSTDIEAEKLVPYPKGIEKYIYPHSLLVERKNLEEDLQGYAAVADGILMVAASAVSDSDKKKAPYGAMVTGRFITSSILSKIKEATKLDISLFTLNEINKDAWLKKVFDTMVKDKTIHFNHPIDSHMLEGFFLLKDVNKEPIAIFRMHTTRDIYQSGLRAVNFFLISFIILALIFSFILISFINKLIVRRLEKLDKEVKNISLHTTFGQRVLVTGNDEITTVSTQINNMLCIIQASQEKLEHRVEERTKELQKTNVQLEREITERRTVEKELIRHKEYLAKLAHFDSLTSLPNRIYFNEMLDKMLKLTKENNKKLAIFFIDLDRFKTINDALGHHMGDMVLKEVGSRINKIMRGGDILARLGGDEFILMLNDVESSDFTSDFANRILTALAKPVEITNHEFYLTASIGICLFPDDGLTLEDLQRNADMAMYKAKRSGGAVFQYFTQDMHLEASEQIKLESSMRNALKNNEFILYFQPKYYVATGIISGVEGLIRWNHPTHGMILPGNFIPHAEETGLILQIGEWVIRESCRICRKWCDLGHRYSVAINISPKQFRHQDLAKLLADVLIETQLDPALLELEITESAVMDNLDQAIEKLDDIKNMGIKVSIDDFGTGYTSISYLKQFPVSYLKIDQSFVRGIPDDQNDLSIITAVIALAHNMNIEVIAEGVESPVQMQWLADQDCDIVQGYFLSRPLSEQKLVLEFEKASKSES